MDSRSPTSPSHSPHQYQQRQMLHTSPQVRPPISPPRSHYDYLPNRSTPPLALGGGASTPYNPTSVRHIVNDIDTTTRSSTGASPSFTNANGTPSDTRHPPSMSDLSPVIPRKRAHVEDILNPVHEEIIIKPPPPDPSTAKTPRSSKSAPAPTPTPKQIIPPSSGSGAITISSSTATSSKSTPNSPAPAAPPVKQPKSIRLHVPLNGSSNVYINFASLAEKTYGPEIFNSKRLLGPQGFASSFLNHDRILETGSDSEAEDDDTPDAVAEGHDAADTEGASGAGVGQKKPPVKRKRQNVQDKYDVEDPFIDDSEALMEQVAAASKDGFFVYSGPLIAEGERAKIDKYIPPRSKVDGRAEQPKKRKAPAKKPVGEKVPRAKKGEKKDKGKSVESGVDEIPAVIAQ